MTHRHDERKVFEIVESGDGRLHEQRPIEVFGSTTVGSGQSSATVDFASAPPGSDLVRRQEQEVVETLMMNGLLRHLAGMFGIEASSAWCLLAATRKQLGLRDDARPGDFDIIVGRARDGVVQLDQLFEVECKRHVVTADGDLREADGTGTTQAQGAVAVGFDAVALLSIFVGEDRALPDGFAPSWRTICNSDHGRAVKRALGKIRANEERIGAEPAYGAAILEVGQLAARDPTYAGAVTFAVTDQPPFRPRAGSRNASEQRRQVDQALEQLLGHRRPHHSWFKFCGRCRRVFAPASARQQPCDGCKR